MGRVNSFEVFDTLITRKVGLPKHIFIMTGIKANEWKDFDLDPEIYAEERLKAEKQLLELGQIPDIAEIHQRLAINININQLLSNKLHDLELDLELENSIPIQKYVNILRCLREKGEKITYISDMYLNARIIRKLLSKHQIISDGEKIHVSCEYGVDKKSGKLFDKVVEELNINKDDLHHFGKSKASDIDGANIAGISSTYLAEANLNRYEKLLCLEDVNHPVCLDDRLCYSKMAACSRQARLSNQGFNKQIYDVAASVAAPLLYSFMACVLHKSKGEVLYFLSRDGYILYKIAEKIVAIQGGDNDLRYLHISREVLVFEQLTEKPDRKLVKSIKKILCTRSLRQLLGKLSVSDHSIKLASIPDSILDKKLSNLKTEDLLSILHDEHIYSDVKKDALKRKEVLHAYLEKEGLFEEKKVSLVDVGWNLTIHKLFDDIFTEKNKPLPKGYYFGINRTNTSIRSGKRTGYLWDLRKKNFKVNIPRITRLIEVFCSAPHGQTVAYEENNGSITPVFNEYEKKHLLKWGVLGMEDAILNFSELMAEHQHFLKSHNMEKIIWVELIKLFWLKPSREEIKAWGTYPFFIGNDKVKILTLHEQKPILKIFYSLIKGNKLSNGHYDSWPVAHIYSQKPLKRNLIKVAMRWRGYLNLQSVKNKVVSLLS